MAKTITTIEVTSEHDHPTADVEAAIRSPAYVQLHVELEQALSNFMARQAGHANMPRISGHIVSVRHE